MQWVDRCMGSLSQSAVPVSVVVVDNASTDGIVQYIRQNYPNVHVIETGSNLGFAKANNIGIRYALDHLADYILLLNQDAWLCEDYTITKLTDTFDEHGDAGIVSPMHLNACQNALDWKFATYLSADCISDAYFGILKDNYAVDYVNAAVWLIKATCVRTVGGFDTNLFVHYGEDSNYLERLHYWKYKVYINTTVHAVHDREFRKEIENEYQQKVFHRDSQIHSMKRNLGNINMELDLDSMIRSNKKAYWINLAKFKIKKARRYKQIDEVLKRIEYSRRIDKKGEMAWL